MGIWELAGVVTDDAAERARPDRKPKPLTIHETITGEWMREDLHFDYWSMDFGTREKQRKCAECGKEGLEWGWICLDNRKLYCADCVEPVQLTMQRKAEQYRAKHRKR